MYSVHDNLKDGGFAPPIPFTNEEMAKRYFRTLTNRTPEMEDNKKDYSLYYLGTFDTESGTYIQDPGRDIKVVMEGVEVNGSHEDTL